MLKKATNSLRATSSGIHRRIQVRIYLLRRRLADEHALIPLSLLGILCGLLTGLVIVAFRQLVEWPLRTWLPDNNAENFEALTSDFHFIMPVIGAFVLGAVFHLFYKKPLQVGVVHVIERLNVNHGHLPAKNAVLQFFAAAFAMVSGQSGGREGPAIHLGAACSSLLGQNWHLPNNSIRVLVGCGTAAAIAASFNTPIAGVIFAMEVVIMEYTISGFTPIILASVAGTVVTRIVYGTQPAFIVPTIEMQSLYEIPYLMLLGLIIGLFSYAFIRIMKLGLSFGNYNIWLRFIGAGLLTGSLAFLVPQIMGTGYDTVNAVLLGELGIALLLLIAAAKLLATAFSCGLGLPIGLIGPNLIIGGCIGGVMGLIGHNAMPELASSQSFYVILGMGAMFGAVLQAPLAALMAMLELTNNANLILPGMLTIITSTLVHSQIFNQKSAYQTTLDHIGSLVHHSPLSQALQRAGIVSIMNQSVVISKRHISKQELLQFSDKQLRWLIVKSKGENYVLLSGIHLRSKCENADDEDLSHKNDEDEIDLLGLSGEQRAVSEIEAQATLHEAWERMAKNNANAVFINGSISPYIPNVTGVVTKHDIEDFYNKSA